MPDFFATNRLRRRLSTVAAFVISVSAVLGMHLLAPSPAVAQVSLSPLVLETQTVRGQAREAISVTNHSNQPFRARIITAPFTYEPTGGFTTLEAGVSHDLTPYLFFSPTELVVPANSTRQIRLMTQFPPDAVQQEYRAVILTEPLQAQRTEDGGIKVNTITRVAATLYVRNGELTPELAVESASWDSHTQRLQMMASNSGAASVRPVANWTLSQGETVVASGRSRATAVVAKSSRRFELVPSAETAQTLAQLSPGIYQLRGEFVWGNNVAPQARPFELEVQVFEQT